MPLCQNKLTKRYHYYEQDGDGFLVRTFYGKMLQYKPEAFSENLTPLKTFELEHGVQAYAFRDEHFGLGYLVEKSDKTITPWPINQFTTYWDICMAELEEETLRVKFNGKYATARRSWVEVPIDVGSKTTTKFPGYELVFDDQMLLSVKLNDVQFRESCEVVNAEEPFTDTEIEILKNIAIGRSREYTPDAAFLIFAGILYYDEVASKLGLTGDGLTIYSKVSKLVMPKVARPRDIVDKKCLAYAGYDRCLLFHYEGNLVVSIGTNGFNSSVTEEQVKMLGIDTRHPDLGQIKKEIAAKRHEWNVLQLARGKHA